MDVREPAPPSHNKTTTLALCTNKWQAAAPWPRRREFQVTSPGVPS